MEICQLLNPHGTGAHDFAAAGKNNSFKSTNALF
jgi:hypothetical protein